MPRASLYILVLVKAHIHSRLYSDITEYLLWKGNFESGRIKDKSSIETTKICFSSGYF